ncbi:MAG: DMT family protein [Chitinophagaceae bacterium]|nr:DMT family protein [Chitinophagaceae bacterium]MBK7558522.1 DMT family protein [Chitinophagaceae bacterium]MBK9530521.1 DMT family protein [Chitinophagaceae bacterium]HQW93051.1 DMT family protein [Ferruginibacter sp.]
MLRTILLLTASNIFMTFAWYGNLKNTALPLWKAILISWGIALFEYMLMVPANRLGFVNGFTGFQLKITQEVITLVVFTAFAVWYLKEPFHWKYMVSFVLILGAVYFAFKK